MKVKDKKYSTKPLKHKQHRSSPRNTFTRLRLNLATAVILSLALLTPTAQCERIIFLSQARSYSPESVAADLAAISTPACQAYMDDLSLINPDLVDDIMGIIMDDEDDLISPEAQKIIDEVNNPPKPISTTAINLKAKDQGKYLKVRHKFTKKIKKAKKQAAKAIMKESKEFKTGKLTRKQFNQKMTHAVKPFKKEVKKWNKVKTKFVLKHAPRKYVQSFVKSHHEKRKINRVTRKLHRARTDYKKLLKKASKLTKKHGKESKKVAKIDQKLKKLDKKILVLNTKKAKTVDKYNKGVMNRMKMGIKNLKTINKKH
jgi:hypothetical protein